MSKQGKETKKKDLYEMITNRICEELEKGIIPWQKPWTGSINGAFNRVSKKPYSFLNQMLLKHDGEYASYKQWQTLGGKVKAGEKAEMVVFWKFIKVEDKNSLDENGNPKTKEVPMLRYLNVFHISQVEGVEPLPKKLKENEEIFDAKEVLVSYWDREQISIEENYSNKAYYSPLRDVIHLPKREQFNSSEEYYSTAFHESVHSTMKKSRCDRDAESHFGSEKYSKEELVAEIGAANLMNIVGIETKKIFSNTTAYIQSWLSALKNNKKMIVSASSAAAKAVNFILG